MFFKYFGSNWKNGKWSLVILMHHLGTFSSRVEVLWHVSTDVGEHLIGCLGYIFSL